MDQLSLQNLVDYLHTAVSENDLLFVYYWFKELEGRGEEGKQAVQSGKHSWKNETAMEAILRSEEKVSETSRIIYAMLKVYGAKLVEEVEMMRDGEGMKERWDMLKSGIEAQAHAALLLSMSEEAAAKWIDECGLAPHAGKVLTGYNPLPQPSTPVLPSPLDEHLSAIKYTEEMIVEPQPRAESHSTDNTSSQSSQNSSPSSSRTSKSTSASYTSPPSSPKAAQNSRPLVFNQTLLNSDPSPLIRIHSLPYLDGESIMTQIMQDHGLSEKPESHAIYQDTRKPPSKSGFILLSFGSKMAARLAVVHLKLQFHQNIELETDYRERQTVTFRRPQLSPVSWRNNAAKPNSSHPWLKRTAEPLERAAEPGEIHDSNPPLLQVSSMTGKLPAKPEVCPAIKEDDSRFWKSFKRKQEKERLNKRFRGSSPPPISRNEVKLDDRYANRGTYRRDGSMEKGDYGRSTESRKGDYRRTNEVKKGSYWRR